LVISSNSEKTKNENSIDSSDKNTIQILISKLFHKYGAKIRQYTKTIHSFIVKNS